MKVVKRTAALAAIGAVALMGCSNSPSNTQQTTPTPVVEEEAETKEVETKETNDDELRTRVKAYSDSFLSGDGQTAYAIFSSRCADRTDRGAFIAMTEQAEGLYGGPLDFKSFEAEVSGTMARVTYTYDVPALNQTQEPWVYEDGQWKQDDC